MRVDEMRTLCSENASAAACILAAAAQAPAAAFAGAARLPARQAALAACAARVLPLGQQLGPRRRPRWALAQRGQHRRHASSFRSSNSATPPPERPAAGAAASAATIRPGLRV